MEKFYVIHLIYGTVIFALFIVQMYILMGDLSLFKIYKSNNYIYKKLLYIIFVLCIIYFIQAGLLEIYFEGYSIILYVIVLVTGWNGISVILDIIARIRNKKRNISDTDLVEVIYAKKENYKIENDIILMPDFSQIPKVVMYLDDKKIFFAGRYPKQKEDLELYCIKQKEENCYLCNNFTSMSTSKTKNQIFNFCVNIYLSILMVCGVIFLGLTELEILNMDGEKILAFIFLPFVCIMFRFAYHTYFIKFMKYVFLVGYIIVLFECIFIWFLEF